MNLPATHPTMRSLVQTQIRRGADPAALRLQYAGLPSLYSHVSLSELDEREPQAIAAARAFLAGHGSLNGKRGLLFSGAPGNGKTMLACALLRGWVEATEGAYAARFWDYTEGMDEIKTNFDRDRDGFDVPGVVELVTGCRLLVIDDLCQEDPTPWERRQLHELFNRAWVEKIHLIVTTNRNLAQILKPAALSRLVGVCHEVRFRGADRRLESAELGCVAAD